MARISTYATARKCDRSGHVSLNCGFARSSLRKDSTTPRLSLQMWQEFQLMRPQVEILATIAEFSRHGCRGEDPRWEREKKEDARTHAGGTRLSACGAGELGRLRRRLHLRVAADTGGRRLDACGAGSACESRPAKKAAIKGRWAGVPIDAFAYGSGTSEFALRNLHKSPDCQVRALPQLRAPTRRRRALTCGDWCRFRAAGRGSDAHSTCGCQAGRAEGAPLVHIF